jgi:hypothetical protein
MWHTSNRRSGRFTNTTCINTLWSSQGSAFLQTLRRKNTIGLLEQAHANTWRYKRDRANLALRPKGSPLEAGQLRGPPSRGLLLSRFWRQKYSLAFVTFLAYNFPPSSIQVKHHDHYVVAPIRTPRTVFKLMASVQCAVAEMRNKKQSCNCPQPWLPKINGLMVNSPTQATSPGYCLTMKAGHPRRCRHTPRFCVCSAQISIKQWVSYISNSK